MPVGRKRKSYGIVRDLDEDFLLQNSSDAENDNDDDSDEKSQSSIPISDNDDDDDDDDDDEDFDLDDDEDFALEAPKSKKKKTAESIVKTEPKKSSPIPKKITTSSPKKKSTTPKKSPTKKSPTKKSKSTDEVDDSFDVVLPPSLLNGNGCTADNQCTLLVEVSHDKDATALGEFGGSGGAIGRFESDPNGITLDLKGNQYRGSILPGPTCMILGFPSTFQRRKDTAEEEETTTGKLKVEGIVDEYATLVQIDDHMKKLDAVVTGNQDDNNDGEDNK